MHFQSRGHAAYHMDGTGVFTVAGGSDATPSKIPPPTHQQRCIALISPLRLRHLTLSSREVALALAGTRGAAWRLHTE